MKNIDSITQSKCHVNTKRCIISITQRARWQEVTSLAVQAQSARGAGVKGSRAVHSTTYLIADANEGIVARKVRQTRTKIEQSEKAANDEPPACRLTSKLYSFFFF